MSLLLEETEVASIIISERDSCEEAINWDEVLQEIMGHAEVIDGEDCDTVIRIAKRPRRG